MTLLVGSIFHMTRKIVSEMTYNVSMGTLNPTIPYHTIPAHKPEIDCWGELAGRRRRSMIMLLINIVIVDHRILHAFLHRVLSFETTFNHVHGFGPLPSSIDEYLKDKREDYQNCSVLYCVPQLYPVICTIIIMSSSYRCFRLNFFFFFSSYFRV